MTICVVFVALVAGAACMAYGVSGEEATLEAATISVVGVIAICCVILMLRWV